VVKDFNPLMGLQNAVLRQDNSGHDIASSEKINLSEALRAYTLGAAEAGDDKFAGTLNTGNRADFVILEQDPYTVSYEQLSAIRVHETWVNGLRQKHAKTST
jgi:predicted amidohydrolase YtcJ